VQNIDIAVQVADGTATDSGKPTVSHYKSNDEKVTLDTNPVLTN